MNSKRRRVFREMEATRRGGDSSTEEPRAKPSISDNSENRAPAEEWVEV
jgi:hypothetical protein